jgi:hypothetical protein
VESRKTKRRAIAFEISRDEKTWWHGRGSAIDWCILVHMYDSRMGRRDGCSRQKETNKLARRPCLIVYRIWSGRIFPVGVHYPGRRNEPISSLIAFTRGRIYGKRCVCYPGVVRRQPLVLRVECRLEKELLALSCSLVPKRLDANRPWCPGYRVRS